MKSLKVISFSLLFVLVIFSCTSDSKERQQIEKEYNPHFINQIETFPLVFRYSGIDSVDFTGTRFVFHDSLSSIKHIEFLSPDTLEFVGDKSKMKNLKSISFFAVRMKNLPKDLTGFENLESLIITKSVTLKTFPNFICGLNKLKFLRFAWGLNLESIPECIGELTSLEYLDLARNNISYLPKSISNLKKLKTLILWDNPISESELTEIKKLLPNTTIYFKTLPY